MLVWAQAPLSSERVVLQETTRGVKPGELHNSCAPPPLGAPEKLRPPRLLQITPNSFHPSRNISA